MAGQIYIHHYSKIEVYEHLGTNSAAPSQKSSAPVGLVPKNIMMQ
jgi:hypothetical protein